ncbi:MAG: hypothetical protein NT091_02315 [Candidatus Falkowbacteria bacterium]|nr:hypothetical protein [Candidatus Falkowbacteria bacterium]
MPNKQELPNRQEDFKINQESKWQVENERLNQLKDRLDDITREAFDNQRPLTTEEIT